MRGLTLLALVLLVTACGGARSTSPDAGATPRATLAPGLSPVAIRTFALASPNAGSERACPAYAVTDPVTGALAGDPADPERIWLSVPSGRMSVSWPAGFTLVFTPDATLYDEAGRLFARAGDTVHLGQIRVGSHAGGPTDPYLAAGLIDASGADGSARMDCAPAADGTPYTDP